MPERLAVPRALNQVSPIAAETGAAAGARRAGSARRRSGRLAGMVVAAAVLGSGLGLAAPLAATASVPGGVNPAPPAPVPAPPTPPPPAVPPPTVVLKAGPPRTLHNTVRHAKVPVVVDTLGMRAVALAATRAGDPYVYGAAGPRAFDCSGLVMWVYDHLGKNLPRTAGDQYNATRHISHSQMKPGDLVFFAHGRTVYHVAIYAGGGWIWAAPYPGKDVEKEKLWTSDFMVGHVR